MKVGCVSSERLTLLISTSTALRVPTSDVTIDAEPEPELEPVLDAKWRHLLAQKIEFCREQRSQIRWN